MNDGFTIISEVITTPWPEEEIRVVNVDKERD